MVFLRRLPLLAMGLALVFGFTFGLSIPAHAQGSWGRMAIVSATMGVSGGRLCVGEASRGDIGCPTYAPTVDSAGLLTTGNISSTGNISANAFYGDGSGLTGINASGIAGLQADRISSTNNQSLVLATEGGTVSFTLGGTPGAAYLHPSLGLVASGVSTTGTISATRGYFSKPESSGPTLLVEHAGSAQGLVVRNVTNNRTIEWDASGASIDVSTSGAFHLGRNIPERLIINPNSTEGVGINLAVNAPTPVALTVSGTLKIANGAEACDANRAGGIRYNSGTFEFCAGSTWQSLAAVAAAGATPDWYSLTNIPAQVVAVSNSTEITMQRISSTYVSASLVQLSVANDGCSTATLGSLRRDPTTGALQFCR